MTRLALAIAIAAAVLPAQAAQFDRVLPDRSRIDFAYTQMGVTMDGRFKTFAGQLSFDPAQPASAKVAVDVQIASIDTGSTDGDTEVAGKQWFNAAAFPTARFKSESVKPLGDNRYEVTGKLTIKGKTRELVVPASFTPNGATGVLEGAFAIRRGDFSVGEGSWSAFDVVANEIQVKFQIVAAAGN
jgi:polyisoprenoid-binding protein YceI